MCFWQNISIDILIMLLFTASKLLPLFPICIWYLFFVPIPSLIVNLFHLSNTQRELWFSAKQWSIEEVTHPVHSCPVAVGRKDFSLQNYLSTFGKTLKMQSFEEWFNQTACPIGWPLGLLKVLVLSIPTQCARQVCIEPNKTKLKTYSNVVHMGHTRAFH